MADARVRTRHYPVIRVFVSSTFSDLKHERNELQRTVFRDLEAHCQSKGFQFQAIDLRWGVPSEAGLDHRTMRICFEELRRSQEISPQPNFLILLGDRYGWRPLPEEISTAEYDKLAAVVANEPAALAVLKEWYRRDDNAVPPVHALRSRRESPDGRDYGRTADGKDDQPAWKEVQGAVWSMINRAFPPQELDRRFDDAHHQASSVPSIVRFQASATEQEIWNGALQASDATQHVFAFARKLSNIESSLAEAQPKQTLGEFVDLRPDGSWDADARKAQTQLLEALEMRLGANGYYQITADARLDLDKAKDRFDVSAEHVQALCTAVRERLLPVIDQQMNEYWQPTGAVRSATAATQRHVRLPQHRHDLFRSTSLLHRSNPFRHLGRHGFSHITRTDFPGGPQKVSGPVPGSCEMGYPDNPSVFPAFFLRWKAGAMTLHRKIKADPRDLQTNTDSQSQVALLIETLNASALGSAMALTAALLCSSNLLFAQAGKTNTPIFADKKAFDETVSPFLRKYCADCHGEISNESDVVLSNIRFDLASGHDMELWKTVLRQLHVEEMPPTGSEQPEQHERDAVMLWINAELKKSGNASDLYAKLESPSFGNYVNHEKLFSGEITAEPFSPARLWRTSPEVFDNTKAGYGKAAKDFRQPFPLEDKVGIKDYASLLFADSAVVSVLLSNAASAADELIKHSSIASSDTSPSDDILAAAISDHFRKVVYREPLTEEIGNYSKLFRETAKEGGNAEAMRLVLMAVMLHHESVYRVEVGLGKEDSHGRRMLSGTEMAFAIAFALTDRRPDAALLQAAQQGQLNSSADVQAQVARILQDTAIDKPRILRFFQEFFGYTQAHKVFKDEDRSGGFAYYGENYPAMYERDADFFVMNILEKDKDVFRQLLTSDEYYIFNRATFRNTVYDFYKKNQQELDAGQYPEARQQELLQRLSLKGWHELNVKYNLHNFNKGFNGSLAAIKQIVHEQYTWMGTKDEDVLLHRMQPLYAKYPMVYDLRDDEQDFLLPQPYRRPNRAGMLTHPAWLIAHSLNDSTDPIRRGKWVRERLLGGVIPDIPITVDASIPEDHTKTLRERLKKTERSECWRCHRKMNPLGYAFEIYDDFGRYRTGEVLGNGDTTPVNAKAELSDTGEKVLDGEFKDALELVPKLAQSDKVRQCMIRHVFRYFMGRNELLSDSKTLIAADRAYLQSGGSFKALLISILSSDSFLYRKTLEPTTRHAP